MKHFFATIFLLLIFITLKCSAQTFTISGSVKASTGEPVAKASVILKNTSYAAIGDTAGYYQLKNIRSGSYEIQVSAIGYQTIIRAIDVIGDLTLNLVMDKNVQQLKDVD